MSGLTSPNQAFVKTMMMMMKSKKQAYRIHQMKHEENLSNALLFRYHFLEV